MGFTTRLQLYGLLLIAIVAIASAQHTFTFPPKPRNFPRFPGIPSGAVANANRSPALPNRSPGLPNPLAPPSISSFLQTYCPLTFSTPFKDPSILETSPTQLAAARAQAGARLNDEQRLYLDGRRQLSKARDARISRDQGRPSGGPSVTRGRSKRQGIDIALLAPTEKNPVCRAVEKVVQSVYTEEDGVCYTFSDEEVRFWECASNFATFPNTNIKLERYYCENDNYVFQSVLSYCPDTDNVRWVTVHVPISCCARRYSCDFTPYSSATGPKRFAQN